ncbi:eCIS core domain-containing protein [Streptomyces achromogenes]|uniref:eCIS core domain-containing protein n=1 Tax=Streptomyces achromogenes TaxID=67255 RepID=UPI003F4D10F0
MRTSSSRAERAENEQAAHDSATVRQVPPAGASMPPPLTAGTLLAVQRGAGNAAATAMISRRARPAAGAEQSDPGVHEVLRSSGKPLAAPVREDMEARFGTDFSDVRLHTGPVAARSARAIGARAYTSGSHVVLGDGGGDKHTLAHELTHVVQQRQGPVAGTEHGHGLRISDPSDRFEREAEANATRVLRAPAAFQGRSAGPDAQTPDTTSAPAVQRMEASSGAGPAPDARPKPGKVLHQPAYASGDQFAVAAMLIADPEVRLYVTHTPDEEGVARKLQEFYTQSGIASSRITAVPVAESDSRMTAVKKASGQKPIGVGDATKYVGENFSEEMREKIRAGWGLDGDGADRAADPVEEWLKLKNVDAKGKKIAVLWSRFSGKNGEVHIEHDSSYLGMAQIIAGLGSLDLVLIVGDAAPKNRQGGGKPKYASIADAYTPKPETDDAHDEEMGSFNAKVVDLTQFWNDDDFKRTVGTTRNHQFQVFDYLDRNATTRHLGFRSGNLEAMALMGFTVRYMEEPDSFAGGSRMEAWHADGDTGRTQTGGLAPGYERIRVSAPPTRSGKHQKSLPAEEQTEAQKHAAWHQQDKDAYGPLKRVGQSPEGRSLPKGFADEDLANIDAYLRTGKSEEGLAPELITAMKEIARDYTDALKELDRAEKAAVQAVNAARKAADDPKKSAQAKKLSQQNAEKRLSEKDSAEEQSRTVTEAVEKRFRELCDTYGLLDTLRARNLFAQNHAHLLPPDAQG